LVRGAREGRSIVYRADIEGMRDLISFLVTDCCEGHPGLCNLSSAPTCDRKPEHKSGKRRR
jgi:hypothetical protein